jgi:hypothetical protein
MANAFLMDQTPNAAQDSSAPNKFPPIVRAVGLGVLVLVLWSIDKVAVSHLPTGSIWRYVVGGVIISVGMATVLSFTDQLDGKQS